jgi:hypothetical protein
VESDLLRLISQQLKIYLSIVMDWSVSCLEVLLDAFIANKLSLAWQSRKILTLSGRAVSPNQDT